MLEPRSLRTLLTLALLVSVAGSAAAQMYEYTDAQGRVHFTDNPALVPEPYRDQLTELELKHDPTESDASGWLGTPIPTSLDPFQPGQPEFESMKGAERWLYTWGYVWIGSVMLWGLISLIATIHAFTTQRIGWGCLNFLLNVTVPFYLFGCLEKPMLVRCLLVLAWAAPFIMMPIVLRAGLIMMTG